ncbi:hypothetical protein EBR43_04815 [bacterium]|nr:hypothetical protein [bacterium]
MRPAKWVHTVSNLSYAEIMKENNSFQPDIINLVEEKITKPKPTEDLPLDSINLFDKAQANFYKDNDIVKLALSMISSRRLDTATNKPKSLWLSLTDPVHKNRLIIPFYNDTGKIIHYQTRTIVEQKNKKYPKYLSKQNSEKSIFGIDRVDQNIKYLFVTEGPIDACFIKNGIAVAGITEGRGAVFTEKQKEQLNAFPLHELIWVLDNQWIDKASKSKTSTLAKQGYNVFIWPEKLKKFKDLNEVCIASKLDVVSEKFILKNTYSGVKANLLLSQIS